MGWDRHKLLWDGNGTDKYVLCTTLVKSIRQRKEIGVDNLKLYHDTLSKTLKKHWLVAFLLWPQEMGCSRCAPYRPTRV